jgi:cytochrome c-type biogenesis protein CcmH/NrfG
MKAESVVFAVAGAFFGLIVGWILGSQQGTARPVAVPQAQAEAQPTAPAATAAPAPKVLDERQAAALRDAATQDPKNVRARVELANLYFDAERYDDASRWYADALKRDPRNVDVSTDLGITYYYLNQPDQALKQFDYSLGIDAKHAKTMMNVGVVRAFGKQDLEGAARAWQQLVDVAPETPEGQAAKRALEGLKSAHPGIGGDKTQPGGKPPAPAAAKTAK